MQKPGKEIPGPEDWRKKRRTFSLDDIDGDDDQEDKEDCAANDEQVDVPGDGECECGRRQDEKHHKQVEDGEPAVFGCGVTHDAGHTNRELTHERNRVPDHDTKDIEEKVGEGDLHGVGEVLTLVREGGDDAGRGRTEVRSQSEWVHAFECDDADTYEWSHSRGEDRATLDDEGTDGPDHDGDVPGQEGQVTREIGVDELLDDEGYASFEQ